MEQLLHYKSVTTEILSSHVLYDFHQQLLSWYNEQYQTPYGCLWASSDTNSIEEILVCANEKRALEPAIVIVIGIGGSYLGTKAVYEALSGYSDYSVPLVFIDTFNVGNLLKIKKDIAQYATQKKNVLLVVVTKSGTTTETVTNFEVILESMQNHYPQRWQELVVVISDAHSQLSSWGRDNTCLTLSIPSAIGGRYSVFTAVGLFPLAVIGIDIKALCKGASDYTSTAFQSCDNLSIKSAQFVYEQYQNGSYMYDLFLFDTRLESLGKWYRQLLAESLGKERDDGSKVTLVPSVSIGTLELHSVAQLMLGAQPNIVTTFIMVHHVEDDIVLKNNATVHTLMNRAGMATQKAYELVGLHYDVITIPELTPLYVGQLLQMYMMQVLYLAQLTHVNPFNQPHVELYKSIMNSM